MSVGAPVEDQGWPDNERRVNSDHDRLIKIEQQLAVQNTILEQQGKSLGNIAQLLERIVVVEERQTLINKRVSDTETELGRWKVARGVFMWASAIAALVLAGIIGVVVTNYFKTIGG